MVSYMVLRCALTLLLATASLPPVVAHASQARVKVDEVTEASAFKLAPNGIPTGSVDRGIVRRLISEHSRELLSCYQRFGGRWGASVQVNVRLSYVGAVEGVSITSASGHAAPMSSCVASSIERWTFPVHQPASLSFPLVFDPAS